MSVPGRISSSFIPWGSFIIHGDHCEPGMFVFQVHPGNSHPFFACIQDAWPYHLWSMSLPGRSSNTCCSFIIHTHYCELGKFLFQVDSGKSQPVFACTQDGKPKPKLPPVPVFADARVEARGLGIERWVVAFFLHKQLNSLWQGPDAKQPDEEAEPTEEADWFLWIIPAPLIDPCGLYLHHLVAMTTVTFFTHILNFQVSKKRKRRRSPGHEEKKKRKKELSSAWLITTL